MEQIFTNPTRKQLRIALRKDSSFPERLLWRRLRNRQINYKFKRQYSITGYVVDFYCPRLKLIIEIDSNYHYFPEIIRYDKKRQAFLESLGLKVIRYQATQVIYELDWVVDDVFRQCQKLTRTSPHPLLGKERG